jgi:ribonuclease HI
MGLGAVFTAPDGTRHTLSQATQSTGCNNEAELRALMAALDALRTLGASTLLVHSDNSVLVEQLSGAKAKPIARLAGLFDEAQALLNSFEHARLKWIPGHRNGQADELARAALGMPPRPAAKPSKRR